MRLLFPVGSIYPSQQGGPSNTVYWLAQELARLGNDVWVIATNKGIQKDQVVYDQWITTSFGRAMYTSEIHHKLPFKLVIRSIQTLRNVDVVHLTSLFYPASLPLAITGLLFGKQILWSTRGELHKNALIYSTWKKIPVLFIIRNLLRKHVYFHSTSDTESQNILKNIRCGKDRIIEIPNYFAIPSAVNDDTVKNYILYLGRIHPIKGLENLIRATAELRAPSEKGYIVKIAGEMKGRYAQTLKKLVKALNIENRVQFIGYVDGVQKEKLFAGAYCTILPSHTENFGNVVIESLVHGTPVIASQGTPWQILSFENAGYWVDNSPDILARSIDEICLLPMERYLTMRKNARNLATRFDIRVNIQKWLAAYQTVASRYGCH